jgi:hypothetical protein
MVLDHAVLFSRDIFAEKPARADLSGALHNKVRGRGAPVSGTNFCETKPISIENLMVAQPSPNQKSLLELAVLPQRRLLDFLN